MTAQATDLFRAMVEALAEAVAQRVADRMAETTRPVAQDAPLTYDAAATRAGLPVSALREAARRGELAVTRIGRRTVRIAPADLERWLRRRRVPARDESGVRLATGVRS